MSRGAADSHVAGGGTCGGDGDSCGVGEIMLFGVRVTVDSMRKSVSMNNLSQYERPNDESGGNNACGREVVAAGYASADDVVHHSSSGRERKRGIPWTEDEHKMFLVGLQKVGKGDWRGISKNFVKTRTPTQVASHAQKYFLRRSNLNRRRRRSSLFDMTTDSVTQMEEDRVNHQDKISQQQMPILESCNTNKLPVVPTFPVPIAQVVLHAPIENPTENLTLGQGDQTKDFSAKLIRPIPILPLPPAPTATDLTLNLRSANTDPSPLSLKLSLSMNQNQTRHSSPFQTKSSFNNGDSMISVA